VCIARAVYGVARSRKPPGWRPGFGVPFEPGINVDRKVLRDLRMHLEAIRDGIVPSGATATPLSNPSVFIRQDGDALVPAGTDRAHR
jgi:hypothetical protein